MSFLSKFLSPKKDAVETAVNRAIEATAENTRALDRLRSTIEDALDRNDIVTGRRRINDPHRTRLQ